MNLFGKKNFVGTFAPPFAVINDAAALETLSRRDKIAGVVEAVKVALLKDPAFYRWTRKPTRRGSPAASVDVLAHLVAAVRGTAPAAHLRQRRSVRTGKRPAARLRPLGGAQARVDDELPRAPRRGGGDRHGARHHIFRTQWAISIAPTTERCCACSKPSASRCGTTRWRSAERTATRAVQGLREFREHLGGELHVTLLRGIGAGSR